MAEAKFKVGDRVKFKVTKDEDGNIANGTGGTVIRVGEGVYDIDWDYVLFGKLNYIVRFDEVEEIDYELAR